MYYKSSFADFLGNIHSSLLPYNWKPSQSQIDIEKEKDAFGHLNIFGWMLNSPEANFPYKEIGLAVGRIRFEISVCASPLE